MSDMSVSEKRPEWGAIATSTAREGRRSLPGRRQVWRGWRFGDSLLGPGRGSVRPFVDPPAPTHAVVQFPFGVLSPACTRSCCPVGRQALSRSADSAESASPIVLLGVAGIASSLVSLVTG